MCSYLYENEVALRLLEVRQCPILLPLCHRRFSQKQCHFRHTHHRCFPIRQVLFVIFSDPCHLIKRAAAKITEGNPKKR